VSLADNLGATVGSPQTVTNLAAGGSQTLSFTWTPMVTGTHILTATAAMVSGETDTADNAGSTSSVVDPAPVHDVAVSGVTVPTAVTVGQAQTVTVTVANQGTFSETFEVSLADNLGATVGSPQTVANLAAGGSQALSFAWTPTVTGTHVLTATAATVSGETDTADNTGSASSVVTAGGTTALDVRVAASSDDAEEKPSGTVDITNGDLELVDDGGIQTVGVRFKNVKIPKGVAVVNAYIQFKVDETSSMATALTVQGEAADNAATFTTTAYSISSRPRTVAAVSWLPVAWPTVGAAGVDQRTSNIASVIQEIVNRPAWASGSSLVMIITGTGSRVAESYNGDTPGAPLLHIDYSLQ
jgi:hypothetical protein